VNSYRKRGEGSTRAVFLLAQSGAILLWRHEIQNDGPDVIALRTHCENHCVEIGVHLGSFTIPTVGRGR